MTDRPTFETNTLHVGSHASRPICRIRNLVQQCLTRQNSSQVASTSTSMIRIALCKAKLWVQCTRRASTRHQRMAVDMLEAEVVETSPSKTDAVSWKGGTIADDRFDFEDASGRRSEDSTRPTINSSATQMPDARTSECIELPEVTAALDCARKEETDASFSTVSDHQILVPYSTED